MKALLVVLTGLYTVVGCARFKATDVQTVYLAEREITRINDNGACLQDSRFKTGKFELVVALIPRETLNSGYALNVVAASRAEQDVASIDVMNWRVNFGEQLTPLKAKPLSQSDSSKLGLKLWGQQFRLQSDLQPTRDSSVQFELVLALDDGTSHSIDITLQATDVRLPMSM